MPACGFDRAWLACGVPCEFAEGGVSDLMIAMFAFSIFVITLNLQSIDHTLSDILDELRKERK